MRGKVLRVQHITRQMLRADPKTLYVFGDNIARIGRAGQAREMRGEPNAVGIPTKWWPAMDEDSFFSDKDLNDRRVRDSLNEAFTRLEKALRAGQNVVLPADGLGTGLAQLPVRAPRIHATIETMIANLSQQE